MLNIDGTPFDVQSWYDTHNDAQELILEYQNKMIALLSDGIKEQIDLVHKKSEEFKTIEEDLAKKRRDLQTREVRLNDRERSLERDFKKLKIKDLLEPMFDYMNAGTFFQIERKAVAIDKCSLCNDQRKIEVDTPNCSAEKTLLYCKCSNSILNYDVIECSNKKYILGDRRSDAYVEASMYGDLKFINISKFTLVADYSEDVTYSHTLLFKDRELAERYCKRYSEGL